MEPTGDFCSLRARDSGEHIYGSAVESVAVWLVLEYPRPWGAKALKESDLPETAKKTIAGWLESIPGARLHFIKRDRDRPAGSAGYSFFVALSTEISPSLFHFALDGFKDLADLPLPALIADPASLADHRWDRPLYLVCTNGRRDRCCAKWGLPFFEAMIAEGDADVWQTTHTGGHRFAPNAICLPHGVTYGWLAPEQAGAFVNAYARSEFFDLDFLRGASRYGRAAQVAHYFVHKTTGIVQLEAFELKSAVQGADTEWEVRFDERASGKRFTVHLTVEPGAIVNSLSCGASEPSRVDQYRLKSLRVNGDPPPD